MSQEEPEDFAAPMRAVQAGSGDAARRLHEGYGRHVLRAVRRHLPAALRPKFDSLDFTQAVWLSFFVGVTPARAFDTPDALAAYLTGMAFHKVIDAVRAGATQK